MQLGSALLWLWLWHRPAATAPIQPLAWEPPYATGAALKKKKKIADSISVLVIDLLISSISSWVSLRSLYLFKNLIFYRWLNWGPERECDGEQVTGRISTRIPVLQLQIPWRAFLFRAHLFTRCALSLGTHGPYTPQNTWRISILPCTVPLSGPNLQFHPLTPILFLT